MTKKAPLYAWQQDVQDEQKSNLDNFLKSEFTKNKYRNRYISDREARVICNKYNLSFADFIKIIKVENEIFIENEKEEISREFRSFLDSQKDYIYSTEPIKRKYTKDYFDYYNELNMEEKIEKHNISIKYPHKWMDNLYSEDNIREQRDMYRKDIHKFFR